MEKQGQALGVHNQSIQPEKNCCKYSEGDNKWYDITIHINLRYSDQPYKKENDGKQNSYKQ